ncbi:hypothetical protein [Natronoglycomyces albus]|uniref:Uncharacterized protein n=1 Tax=Natronoglycomyces albus TaxID=2811108 RepID=A0A895XRG2_9ACTN|nr:hypothetical protein [Natronoglycomyces albus]QSB05765.1 hypothetical protein JQS30_02205 [Natronoglycomyces albus]
MSEAEERNLGRLQEDGPSQSDMFRYEDGSLLGGSQDSVYESIKDDVFKSPPKTSDGTTLHDGTQHMGKIADGFEGGYADGKKLYDEGFDLETLLSLGGNVGEVLDSAESLIKGLEKIFENPISWLIQLGLDILVNLVKPLEDLVGLFLGNEDRLKTSGSMWEAAGQEFLGIADNLRTRVEGPLGQWQGDDADMARLRINEQYGFIRVAALACRVVKELLDAAAKLAQNAYAYVLKELSDFLAAQATQWLISMAASAVTFGGTIATQIATTVVSVARRIIAFIKFKLQVSQVFQVAVQIFNTVIKVLQNVKPVMDILTSSYNVGKHLVTAFEHDGTFGEAAAGFAFDATGDLVTGYEGYRSLTDGDDNKMTKEEKEQLKKGKEFTSGWGDYLDTR